jgi:hypothetical protein
MALTATDTLHDIAEEASAVFEGRYSLPLFSARYTGFDLDEAYRASALAHKIRLGKGYQARRPQGRFTNSRIGMNTACARRTGVMSTTARYTISPRHYRLRSMPSRRSSRKSSSGFRRAVAGHG